MVNKFFKKFTKSTCFFCILQTHLVNKLVLRLFLFVILGGDRQKAVFGMSRSGPPRGHFLEPCANDSCHNHVEVLAATGRQTKAGNLVTDKEYQLLNLLNKDDIPSRNKILANNQTGLSNGLVKKDVARYRMGLIQPPSNRLASEVPLKSSTVQIMEYIPDSYSAKDEGKFIFAYTILHRWAQ